ncbi:transcriptional regulator [Desulfocucumis palustris]|uniref:Transcriptional regulator n=1 Tax=Desulfocucumis palustris TaxID=1898651 RepID=A0A2L2XC40_9FIRM|nr:MarR family transcriptional regulator [Desulfocucumis palustris]GBF33897.1 transcriptional regulator [Desulfocucumis palustris]
MQNEDENVKILVENLLFIFRALHRGLESLLPEDGLTVPQRFIMGHLIKHGSMSVKELGQKVGLTHSTVSGIVDRLERKGMAIRVQDLQDRRITKVTITDLGRNHLHRIKPRRMFSLVVDSFNNAPAGEQRKILDGLAALRRLLDDGK